jgi:hypothetical protein
VNRALDALDALDTTWRICREADWTGWDPYDGLMARRWPATWLRRSRIGRLALIQGVKRTPYNLRPLLDVPQLRNPKALALGLDAACRMTRLPAYREEARAEARRLAVDLLECATPTASGQGWGYPFDWQARAFWIPREVPTVVCTGFVVRALDHARSVLDDDGELRDRIVGAISAAARFVLKDLNRTEESAGFCWSYSPLDRSRVVNATLLGAEVVARAAAVTGRRELLEEVVPTVAWSLDRQTDEGGWSYGDAGHHRWEDGFHTGFNLMSYLALRECTEALGGTADALVPLHAIARGADHYAANFFDAEGRPWYYRDRPWPIDPHAAAVAILVLRATAEHIPAGATLAERVLDWTLANLRNDDGTFVFQLRRGSTDRTPFLRWSQAWMLLALADRCGSEANAPMRIEDSTDATVRV